MKIFVYSASLRKESINLKLSKLIAKVAEANGAEVDFARMSDFDMPAFNMDDQQSSGIPAGAQALADRITNSDGMILTSPEYNWLPPATIKNAVDWLSRIQPVPLDKKSVLLSSASPSLVGGVRGLMSLRLSFEALGTWVYPKMFTLAQAPGAFDDDGNILASGEEGELAVRREDEPVLLLEYWQNPEATEAQRRDQWWRMGDVGTKDEDGYLWFVGRADDVITSSGYRIGPGEIEDCLCKHPAVSLAAAVGIPNSVRTENIKVFIKLAPGHNGSPQLEDDIRGFVKTYLSPHEYPRMVEFVSELPLTATGKIKRKNLRDAEIAKLMED